MSLPSLPVFSHPSSLSGRSRGLLQAFGLATLFWVFSQCIVHLGLPISAGPAGFFLILAALYLQIIPVDRIEHGAKWLIAQSAIFMVPPVVAVARAWPVLEANWLPLAWIIVGGTFLTTVITALSVELACILMRSKDQ